MRHRQQQLACSLNGSQLKTRKPVVEPQAKQPWSWLKPNCRSSMSLWCQDCLQQGTALCLACSLQAS